MILRKTSYKTRYSENIKLLATGWEQAKRAGEFWGLAEVILEFH